MGHGFAAGLDEVGRWGADGRVGHAFFSSFDVTGDVLLETRVGVDLNHEVVPAVGFFEVPVLR
jgi:hypothetical protein